MKKLLFELGLEEIPADLLEPGLEQLKSALEKLLTLQRLVWSSLQGWATPRRLAVFIEGLPERQADHEELLLGPPRSVALAQDGSATPAALGFARKMGVKAEQLEVIETEKGAYLGFRRLLRGQSASDILAGLLPEAISQVTWPKNMYWRSSRFRYIRPIRWIVALLGEEVVEFEFEGVRSGRHTRGHRFLGRGVIELASPDEYLDRLRENFVLADSAERRDKIEKELAGFTPKGCTLLQDPKLLETVVNLNEYPSVIRGAFDVDFLEIPQEVLITVMRHHQKYFSLVDSENSLQPAFLAVLNTRSDEDGRIRAGHERVLKARLQDASFFWEGDRRLRLEERVKRLGEILFQENLGTYLEKTERMRKICSGLGGGQELDEAARLSKADLTSEMVREFPELQGIMGGLYARSEGLPEGVWKAIYEHYRPLSLNDRSPSTGNGALLSLADRTDTLVGCFGVGIVPTGSRDPFALRRQAQGIVRILLDHRLQLTLAELIEHAMKHFVPERPVEEVRANLDDFLKGRLRFLLQEKGLSYDVVNAVLAVPMGHLHKVQEKAEALSRIRNEPDFEALATAFKRIRNILSNQDYEAGAVEAGRLEVKEEQALFQAFSQLRPEVEARLAEGDFSAALKGIAGLRGVVDAFFDEVLVLAPQERLRSNRLRLLDQISSLFLQIADISEIVQSDRPEKDREGEA